MDYSKAYGLKKEMAAAMLAKKRKKITVISFAAGTSGAALNTNTDLLRYVNGVGLGQKPDGGQYIKILTRNPLRTSATALRRHYGLQSEDIRVETIGEIRFQNLRLRHRPPFPGISVGHYRITAGTLGCFVQDEKGTPYILSNNHVLANSNKGFYADAILQPGPLDGGRKKSHEIARLSHLVPLDFDKPNAMDAAIARVNTDVLFTHAVGGAKKVTGIATPVNKMKVEKYGRTTGYTTGSISTRNLDLEVDFDGQLVDFEDQFEVKGSLKNGKRTKFCDGGDSGSLILERGTHNAVGLLFAGSEDGTTFATPIAEVLDAFSVKML